MEGDRATFDHRNGTAKCHAGKPTVALEPALADQAPVADDAHAGQTKLLFAEFHQLAQVFASLVKERFSARKVDLLHTWEGRQRPFPFCFYSAHTSVIILMAKVIWSQCSRREIKLLIILASSDAGAPPTPLYGNTLVWNPGCHRDKSISSKASPAILKWMPCNVRN